MIDQYTEQPSKKQRFHQDNRDLAVIRYLETHGPMPRKQALTGIVHYYKDHFTRGNSVSLDQTRFRMVSHLREMVSQGKVIRGARTEEVLSLPQRHRGGQGPGMTEEEMVTFVLGVATDV
jgi:hypothetical protein